MLIITVFCNFDSVTLSKDICTLRDILRDQLVLKTEKIRDTTSQAFTMSLIKRTECNLNAASERTADANSGQSKVSQLRRETQRTVARHRRRSRIAWRAIRKVEWMLGSRNEGRMKRVEQSTWFVDWFEEKRAIHAHFFIVFGSNKQIIPMSQLRVVKAEDGLLWVSRLKCVT